MEEFTLFEAPKEKVVNVATVPMRSPFRYPGGKTWFVPRLRRWLLSRDSQPSELIEPFAGGGIISLTVAFERLAEHVTMVELDKELAAVWHTILEVPDGAESLADRIVNFKLTPQNVRAVLNREPETKLDRAFRTILKNRVNRGGILAPGASLLRTARRAKACCPGGTQRR